MAKFKFDQAITILANLGVIAGLIFVGLQLAVSEVIGSTSLGRATWEEQRTSYTREFVDFVDQTVSNLDSSE